MNFAEYQRLARRSEKPLPRGFALHHHLMGIASEAGELADTLKRFFIYEQPLDQDNIHEELGDLLWYIAGMATACGFSLDDVAEANILKLQKRYPSKYTDRHAAERLDKQE